MEVVRAKTAGFCMGVSLALQKLEKALLAQEQALEPAKARRICTLGPIIHNPQVLEHFAARGVSCVRNVEDLETGDHVLIRAHGLTREEEARARVCGATVEDATCPRVKGAQLSIARATREGAALLLFGEAEHPEVRGLLSYAAGESQVFGSLDELAHIPLLAEKPYVLASQTTQDREAFAAIEAWLVERLPMLAVLNTICGATRERQEEARAIAGGVDVMVVVGGRESGNTRRLAALAAQAGVETFHVERPEELEAKRFATKSRAGLTAGASTPKSLIDAAEEWLASI